MHFDLPCFRTLFFTFLSVTSGFSGSRVSFSKGSGPDPKTTFFNNNTNNHAATTIPTVTHIVTSNQRLSPLVSCCHSSHRVQHFRVASFTLIGFQGSQWRNVSFMMSVVWIVCHGRPTYHQRPLSSLTALRAQKAAFSHPTQHTVWICLERQLY